MKNGVDELSGNRIKMAVTIDFTGFVKCLVAKWLQKDNSLA